MTVSGSSVISSSSSTSSSSPSPACTCVKVYACMLCEPTHFFAIIDVQVSRVWFLPLQSNHFCTYSLSSASMLHLTMPHIAFVPTTYPPAWNKVPLYPPVQHFIRLTTLFLISTTYFTCSTSSLSSAAARPRLRPRPRPPPPPRLFLPAHPNCHKMNGHILKVSTRHMST